VAAVAQAPGAPFTVQQVFDAFLVFMALGTWVVFTYVGEKMAWHTVYFATWMALLGGWWLGRVLERAAPARGILADGHDPVGAADAEGAVAYRG
jgi:hypothetical protein